MTPHSAPVTGRKLIVVLSGGMGDCLLASPFLRHFRRTRRYRPIVVAVPRVSSGLFALNPCVDLLIPCDGSDLLLWGLPEEHADIFVPYLEIQPPPQFRPGMTIPAIPLLNPNTVPLPVVDQVARHHGIALRSRELEVFSSAEDERWAEAFVRERPGRPLLLLNPASALVEKNLPPDGYRAIAAALLRDYHVLALPLDGYDAPGVEVLAPLPEVRRSAALFRRLHAVVTVDSFPGHLAAAVGVPAVVLFGPSNPATFGHACNVNLRPSACPVCADTPRRPACRRHRCMESFTPALVLEAVRSLSAQRRASTARTRHSSTSRRREVRPHNSSS